MKRKTLIICLMLCVLSLFSGLMFGQIRQTGIIQGNVTDSEGAALPGATVAIESPNLIGGPRSAVTDSQGFYMFPSLAIGIYKVSVSLAGFNTLVKEGIRLHANITLTVDFKMSQEKLNKEVLVEAAAPTVDIKSSSTGSVIMTAELLTSIPSNKSFEAIVNLAPGSDYFTSYGSGYASPNRYQMDGIEVTSPLWGGINFAPDYNIFEEATVQGLGLPAEFGEFTGSVVTTVTKSGSNTFSGFNEIRYNGHGWNSQNLGSIPDSEFYDPASKQTKFSSGSLFDIGLQLGGRIVRDRLWFFISGEYDTSKQYPLGTTVNPKYWTPRIFGKLTYQLNTSNTVNLAVNYHNERAENILASASFAPGIDLDNFFPGWYANLSWTSILSPKTYLDFKFGYNWKKLAQLPKNGKDVAGHYDLFLGTYSGNYPYFMESSGTIFNPSLHLSHYIPEFIKGSHDIKVGTEIEFFKTINAGGYPGGVSYDDFNGQPSLSYTQAPHSFDNSFRTIVGFFQDTWSITKRLTLNLGLRYDNYRYEIPSPTLGVIYKKGNFSPRLGATYDLLGDRKNVLKIFYGHYYEGLFGNFFSSVEDRYSDLIVSSWNGTQFVELYRQKYQSLYSVDPKAGHPYLRELSGGYERELFKDASLAVNFYYRTIGRAFGAVNIGAEWKKVTITNPGPDGIVGTTDDMGPIDVYEQTNPGADKYILTNPKKGQSETMLDDPKKWMAGFEIIFNKKFSNRWQMIASYHYTKAKGNTDNVLTYLGRDPNNFVNAYGDSTYYFGQPHQLKVQASVLLPWDILLGLSAQYISGQIQQPGFYAILPQGYTFIPGEAPGTTRTDPRKDFDVRLEKGFTMRTLKVAALVDIFNLFNTHETPFAWNRQNQYGPFYGKIFSVKDPRTFRIGLRVTY